MNEARLARLMPEKRARQILADARHQRFPTHRNGKGNPFKGKNKTQRQRISAGFSSTFIKKGPDLL